MKILIIEDEERLAKAIQKGLKDQGFAVDHVDNGADGLAWGLDDTYDLIILDRMLPEKDGLEVCRELRRCAIKTPLLMLTALANVDDKVCGLDAGADDYLTKPFDLIELLSRVRALIRRGVIKHQPVLKTSHLRLDTNLCQLRVDGQEVNLTPKEYGVLYYLLTNQGRFVGKQELIDHVWDNDADTLPSTVEVYIWSIRKKLNSKSTAPIIETRRGFGYRIGKNNV